MERINTADGLFHEGNPATGEKGTKVTAEWLNALQEEVIGMAAGIRTIAATATLLESDGIIFADTSAGAMTIHLPTYANVGSTKRYIIKNGGVNSVTLDAAEGKTIDGELTLLLLAPGDRCTIVKDGVNWQTI